MNPPLPYATSLTVMKSMPRAANVAACVHADEVAARERHGLLSCVAERHPGAGALRQARDVVAGSALTSRHSAPSGLVSTVEPPSSDVAATHPAVASAETPPAVSAVSPAGAVRMMLTNSSQSGEIDPSNRSGLTICSTSWISLGGSPFRWMTKPSTDSAISTGRVRTTVDRSGDRGDPGSGHRRRGPVDHDRGPAEAGRVVQPIRGHGPRAVDAIGWREDSDGGRAAASGDGERRPGRDVDQGERVDRGPRLDGDHLVTIEAVPLVADEPRRSASSAAGSVSGFPLLHLTCGTPTAAINTAVPASSTDCTSLHLAVSVGVVGHQRVGRQHHGRHAATKPAISSVATPSVAPTPRPCWCHR